MRELLKNRRFLVLFSLMFSIVCLLNVNYCLLRGARNTLTVTDLGSGAGSIPFFELCGTMPAAVLMVFILTRLLNRFSIHKVFLLTLATFAGFFLVFATMIYPSLHLWQGALSSCAWLPGHNLLSVLLPQGFSMLFFVMSELWKIALLTVLFWGLVNKYIPLNDAKQFYAPLMFGGSVGAMLSGPLISLCKYASNGSWSRSLTLSMIALTILSVIIARLYTILWSQFAGPKIEEEEKKEHLSLFESIRLCFKSRYLLLLAWITIADYIAYTLGEVIFLDVLKQKYPDPSQFYNYNGQLNFWSGLLTAFSALVVTPILLKKCKWVVASMITPLCLVITEAAFFFVLWSPSKDMKLELLVFIGTIFFCVVRAAKHTLYETSKEISFLLLPSLEKMQGKLVIDGMCSRIGRGGASLVSIVLIQMAGGVLASAFVAGWLAIAIGVSCVFSTLKLGLLVERKSKPEVVS